MGRRGWLRGRARDLRQLLINRARPYLFSTAQAPATVGALAAALDEVQRDPTLMERLWANTRYFKAELQGLGFDIFGSTTPITPVIFGRLRRRSRRAACCSTGACSRWAWASRPCRAGWPASATS